MTGVASETVAFSNRAPQFQRSQSPSPSQESDTPFAMMLDASAPPPTDPAPRRPEPSEPASSPPKAAVPDNPKQRPAETPATRAADAASEPAGDATASEQEIAPETEVAIVAVTESPTGEALPEAPMEETASDGSESQDAETVVVQAQAQPPQGQTTVAPNVAVAVPAAPTAEVIATAPAEGETAPDFAIRPAGAASVPAATSAPEASAIEPAIEAPDLPALKTGAKSSGDAPVLQDKSEVTPTHAPADEDGRPVKADGLQAAQQARPEHARPLVQHEQGEQKPVEAKPQTETQQAAEAAQHKPAPQPSPGDGDTTRHSTLPPLPAVTVPDAASGGASHARAALVTSSAVPVAGIAVEIAAQARAGNNRFEIRLDPPELGRIDVRLDVDHDGNVKSRLVIERADTYDLLRRDSSTLERALQQAGLKTSDNGLEFTLRDQGSAQREARDQNQRHAEHAIIPDADALPAEAASGYGRVLGLGGGVDIRI